MNMEELRCNCDQYKPLLAKFDGDVVEIKCRKCKKNHLLGLIDGKIQEIPNELIEAALKKNFGGGNVQR